MARYNQRQQRHGGEYESLLIEVKAWLMEKGLEPNAALEAMDWTEIAPLMDVQYRIYHSDGEADKGAAKTEAPQSKRKIVFDGSGIIADVLVRK